MMATRKADGVVLKFVTRFRIRLFLNNRSILEWSIKLVIFWGRHKSMTPNPQNLAFPEDLFSPIDLFEKYFAPELLWINKLETFEGDLL